jgi:hypothetical protein
MMKVKMPRITQFFHLKFINQFSLVIGATILRKFHCQWFRFMKSQPINELKFNAFRARISVTQLKLIETRFSLVTELPERLSDVISVNKGKALLVFPRATAKNASMFVYFVKCFSIARFTRTNDRDRVLRSRKAFLVAD